MNILFLTLVGFDSINERNIYTDLLREFIKNGHYIYAISPIERRNKIRTHLVEEKNFTILRLRIGNTQKTNVLEKGISTILIEPVMRWAIKKYFSNVKFDLILYTTPPITLMAPIEYVKRRDKAKTYLLLKDIFPQNAVDMGMLSVGGLRGILYKFFRKKEKRLYSLSDCIGCMSKANVDYIIRHNPELINRKVEICPNSIEVIDKSIDAEMRKKIRLKYGIPLEKIVFIYGGNLGKPQGIPFAIDCLRKCSGIEEAYFLIVGDGTEYERIQSYIDREKPKNVRLMRHLPKEDYDTMVGACDVGLVFLDYRFTIPNFPSRLLGYLQAKLPVFAVTDTNTDIGKIITEGGFGWWCESNSVDHFKEQAKVILTDEIEYKGEKGFVYLQKNYDVKLCYDSIMRG